MTFSELFWLKVFLFLFSLNQIDWLRLVSIGRRIVKPGRQTPALENQAACSQLVITFHVFRFFPFSGARADVYYYYSEATLRPSRMFFFAFAGGFECAETSVPMLGKDDDDDDDFLHA